MFIVHLLDLKRASHSVVVKNEKIQTQNLFSDTPRLQGGKYLGSQDPQDKLNHALPRPCFSFMIALFNRVVQNGTPAKTLDQGNVIIKWLPRQSRVSLKCCIEYIQLCAKLTTLQLFYQCYSTKKFYIEQVSTFNGSSDF